MRGQRSQRGKSQNRKLDGHAVCHDPDYGGQDIANG